jgi:threonine/homoserine/homoserine lactone efflux protein
MELMIFLAQVVLISLSGVMAPGPVTATTIAIGSRNRFAGTLVSIGHGIVELPLIIIITLGMGTIFQYDSSKIAIGLAGGAMLVFMAVQIFRSIKKLDINSGQAKKDKPILAGIILTAGNPYFLVWWATVGLKLATDAKGLGIWAFAAFALVHWLCDLIWCQALSWASFKGTRLLGAGSQKIVLTVCSAAMFLFGIKFAYDAARLWLQ